MSRPRNAEPHTNWKISIPATLAARVEMTLMDPGTRKPRYSERSKLICQLLERHLAEQHRPLEQI